MTDLYGGNTNWPTLRFANEHLGKEIYNTPDVWVAMRESGYTYYPQVGNYNFFMMQDDQAPGGQTVPLTWRPAGSGAYEIANTEVEAGQAYLGTTTEGWICRRTDQGTGNPFMYFDVNDAYLFGGSNAISMTDDLFRSGHGYLDAGIRFARRRDQERRHDHEGKHQHLEEAHLQYWRCALLGRTVWGQRLPHQLQWRWR